MTAEKLLRGLNERALLIDHKLVVTWNLGYLGRWLRWSHPSDFLWQICPCKQTTDKMHTLEDVKRFERWKMEKTATTIKSYHDSFTDNALPLVHLRRIKAQCDKSTSCPCQRGWCFASIQVLQNNSAPKIVPCFCWQRIIFIRDV